MTQVLQIVKSYLAAMALVLFLAAPLSARAADTAPSPSYTAVAPLKFWQEQTKAKIEYMGTAHGIDLWMAVRNGNLQLIYTTPDKNGMLLDGMLFSGNGINQTEAVQRNFVLNNRKEAEGILQTVGDMRENAIKPSSPTAIAAPAIPAPNPVKKPGRSEELWRDLTGSSFISFGAKTTVDNAAEPIVYMFADPKCDHCHALWKILQPKIAEEALEVRLIPVAVLGKESMAQAEQLLSQSDMLAAWDKVMAGKALETPANAAGKASFAVNQKIFMNYKLKSTPTLIYRQHSSDTVRLVVGNPDDIKLFYADIGMVETAPKGMPDKALSADKSKE